MKKAWLILAFVFVGTLTLCAQKTPGANSDEPRTPSILDYIVRPNSIVFNRPFSEWDVEWQQWSYSIPVANHPLFDHGDCSVGQHGDVWFLGGKFCGNTEPNCGTSDVQRSCTIPYGKMIYFPISNGEDSAVEEDVAENPGDISKQQIGYMRFHGDPYAVAPPLPQYAIIDGVTVPHLERYFVQSSAFGFTMPDDNLLKAIYPPPNNDFKAGTYFPAVDNGTYLMFAPLPPGPHVIKFGVNFPT